jgi:PAS domain S-box-containing protein
MKAGLRMASRVPWPFTLRRPRTSSLSPQQPPSHGIKRSPMVYVAIAGLFAFVGWLDFNLPLGLVLWLFYLIPIWLLALLVPFDHRVVIAGAVTTMGLVATSWIFSPESLSGWMGTVNRSIGVVLVWIVAWLLIRARRQEAAIRWSELRARALVQASAQVLWVAEADGTAMQDSPSWRAFTGQTAEARREWGWLQAVHPDDRARVERQWRETVSRRHPLNTELRLRHRQGDYRWTSLCAVSVLHDDGSVGEWVGMHTDVTARKAGEEALRQSEEQFRAHFELAAVGQAQVDARTGCFIRVNDRLCDITGYSRTELLQLTPHDLTHSEDQPEDDREIRRVLGGEVEEYHSEKRYCRKDGELRWVRVSARLIHDAEARPLRSIAVIEDITDRKGAEAALLRLAKDLERGVADRTKELTESHERLRALTSQLNLTEQRERRRLAADLHDYLAQLLVVAKMKLGHALSTMKASAVREPLQEAEGILDQALTYTRSLVAQLVPPVLEQFGLSASLLWLGEQMRRHGLIVHVEVPSDPPPLTVDQAALLYQSVRELLMNVVKHANTSEATVVLTYEEGRMTVVVHDEGTGFVDTGDMGDKFGLFSIRERMHALGGGFVIESTPEHGTTGTLLLALAPTAVNHESQPAADAFTAEAHVHRALDGHAVSHQASGPLHAASRSSIRVMLVDDHAMVREGLKSILLGYADVDVVGEAGDGEQAVELAGRVMPDVIVMDVNMPNMDGIDATRRIAELYPGIGVIGLSVNATPQVAEAMSHAGARTLLTKESAAESLYLTIKRVADAEDGLSSQTAQESLPFLE